MMATRAPERGSLKRMFQNISEDYDFVNRLLTLGLDRHWRRKAASFCASSDRILDLCCGTGDLLFAIMKSQGSRARIIGVDFTREMIARAPPGPYGPFVLADAAHLPFKERSFDCVAIAFSFRNLLYKNPRFDEYLDEVLRILGRGGRFVVLETSQPEREMIRKLYHLYLKVVPLIGRFASGNGQAYQYLSLSARNQPTSREVSTKLMAAGFRHVGFWPLSLGVVGIHIATK